MSQPTGRRLDRSLSKQRSLRKQDSLTLKRKGSTNAGDLLAPHDEESQLEKPLVDQEHYSQRSQWLRAAVLGANDGLISTAGIMMGVSATDADSRKMIISGVAGLVSGALSMAAGEYVSVYSQRDAENADIQRCIDGREKVPGTEAQQLQELTDDFEEQGLPQELARQVAEHLYKQDPVKNYAKIEIGIDVDDLTNPWLAATSSALSFSIGALIAILSAAFIRDYVTRLAVLTATCTVALAGFGVLSASLGGAPRGWAAARVVVGGWLALFVSYVVLHYFDAAT